MSINILVVEDEAIIALDIKFKLERMGYQVVTVPSGEMALNMIEKGDFDIVLMDMSLNGELNGIETAVLIRDSYFDSLLVYITANTNLIDNEKINQTKPYECLSKPLEDFELERVIKNYVLESYV